MGYWHGDDCAIVHCVRLITRYSPGVVKLGKKKELVRDSNILQFVRRATLRIEEEVSALSATIIRQVRILLKGEGPEILFIIFLDLDEKSVRSDVGAGEGVDDACIHVCKGEKLRVVGFLALYNE